MNASVKVRLTKLFLWVEPPRFQAWPELLARLDPSACYPTTASVAKAALGFQPDQAGNVKFDEVVFNLPGWDKTRAGEPILRGIGLLEKRNPGYAISEAGRKLVNLYRSDPASSEWKTFLAILLLKREPRTRVMMQMLVKPDAALRFAKPSWFGGRFQDARIELPGHSLQPFPPKSAKDTPFHHLIQNRAKWALGEWRGQPEVEQAGQVILAGAETEGFSLNDIGRALRGSLELFLNLGLVSEAGGEVTWQAPRAAQLLPPELLADLDAQPPAPPSPEQLIFRYIRDLSGDNGFLVFSELRQRALSEGIANPDQLVDALIHRGVIDLVAHDYGQPIHGEGLLGDPRKQLVRFVLRQNPTRI